MERVMGIEPSSQYLKLMLGHALLAISKDSANSIMRHQPMTTGNPSPALRLHIALWIFRRKYDLGGEQRAPFSGGGAVVRSAADEFVWAVEVPHEAGGAEPGDRGGLKNEGVEWDSVRSFNFHAASMTEGVGHWLSMGKINFM